MILALDANVCIYVLEQNQDFWQDALTIVKAVESGSVVGVASELHYLEVLAGKTLTSQGIATAEYFLHDSGLTFVPIDRNILREAARLRRTAGNLKTPDAIHLATALAAGATHFVTNDHKLLKKKIEGIELITLIAVQELLL